MTTTATIVRSKLNVYDEREPHKPLVETTDGAEIARLLGEVGVRFERWTAEKKLSADADQAAILDAYRSSVERVQSEGGYGTVDVLRLAKGTANVEPIRKKFLAEHAHTEDEVRFFVEGSGAFYLRLAGKVYQAICARGDLISVPAGTLHWFDMGPDPEFAAIRWFNNQEGWVPQYTGDDIASRFPLYE
jgi:1,2-dihydroxy-3-keto-5-methylthiopentene dioxygenase